MFFFFVFTLASHSFFLHHPPRSRIFFLFLRVSSDSWRCMIEYGKKENDTESNTYRKWSIKMIQKRENDWEFNTFWNWKGPHPLAFRWDSVPPSPPPCPTYRPSPATAYSPSSGRPSSPASSCLFLAFPFPVTPPLPFGLQLLFLLPRELAFVPPPIVSFFLQLLSFWFPFLLFSLLLQKLSYHFSFCLTSFSFSPSPHTQVVDLEVVLDLWEPPLVLELFQPLFLVLQVLERVPLQSSTGSALVLARFDLELQ